MIETIRFILVALLMAAGLGVLISAVVGVFRFRYSLNRIHAGALVDTVGILLMLTGLMIAEGFDITTLKMLLTVLILWLSSPVGSHLIGRLEITVNNHLDQDMQIDDDHLVRWEKEGK